MPFDVVAREWRSTVQYEPIVYRVRVWQAHGSGPLSIKRAGGDDPDGILDIGESQHGRGRLDRFAKVALGEKLLSHRAGIEYSTKWGYAGPPERYTWVHKDRPPLNSSTGKYEKVEAWLKSMKREPRDSDGWLNLDGLIDDLIAPL